MCHHVYLNIGYYKLKSLILYVLSEEKFSVGKQNTVFSNWKKLYKNTNSWLNYELKIMSQNKNILFIKCKFKFKFTSSLFLAKIHRPKKKIITDIDQTSLLN